MDARTKAVKTHRRRLKARRMQRVEVTVRKQDATLVRKLVARLRHNDDNADRLRCVMRAAVAEDRGPTLLEALYDPVVSGPEFDEVFEEIERSRHHPIMMKVRDLDL